MGSKITKLKPVGGFCAETAGAITLFGTALAGIPVSTTHTITGAIAGVGSVQRASAVRWGVARQIVWAWVLTIPVFRSRGRSHFRGDSVVRAKCLRAVPQSGSSRFTNNVLAYCEAGEGRCRG